MTSRRWAELREEITMLNSKLILPVFLLSTLTAAIAAPNTNPAKAQPSTAVGNTLSPAIKASLIEERVNRGQIAACANLAALRGASARTSGADYATQNRVLEVTFLLCMSGAPIRD
jgi:hypothetical protein